MMIVISSILTVGLMLQRPWKFHNGSVSINLNHYRNTVWDASLKRLFIAVQLIPQLSRIPRVNVQHSTMHERHFLPSDCHADLYTFHIAHFVVIKFLKELGQFSRICGRASAWDTDSFALLIKMRMFVEKWKGLHSVGSGFLVGQRNAIVRSGTT